MKPLNVSLYELALVCKEFELTEAQELAIIAYLRGFYEPFCQTCAKHVVPGFSTDKLDIRCTNCYNSLSWEPSLDSFMDIQPDDDIVDEIRSLWNWLFEQGVFEKRLPTWLSFRGRPLDKELISRFFISPLNREQVLFLCNFVLEDDNMIKTFILIGGRCELPEIPKTMDEKLALPYGSDLPKAYIDNMTKILGKKFPPFMNRILRSAATVYDAAKKYENIEDIADIRIILDNW
jgi:hypothetical protein